MSAIQGLSDKFKKLWDVFEEIEYHSYTSIAKIIEFIECLVKKKGEWTQFREGAKVLHDFLYLSPRPPSKCSSRIGKRIGIFILLLKLPCGRQQSEFWVVPSSLKFKSVRQPRPSSRKTWKTTSSEGRA